MQNLENQKKKSICIFHLFSCRYRIGETFMALNKEEEQGLLDKEEQSIEEDIKSVEDELSSIKATLADLKQKLYAKFSTSINLEDEDD